MIIGSAKDWRGSALEGDVLREDHREALGAAVSVQRESANSVTHALILSSSLLTDRMIEYALAPRMPDSLRVTMWCTGSAEAGMAGRSVDRQELPEVLPFREWPYTYLRRLNDYAWDYRHAVASRESMWRHVRARTARPLLKALRAPARALAVTGLHGRFEQWLQRRLLMVERSPEATRRLLALKPDVVLCTGPHRYEEPAVVASATRLGIPVLALITSWDNLTTKNRMPMAHDGHVVWSERMREELHRLYPKAERLPTYSVGAPQFDVFHQARFRESREDFCRRHALDPARSIILYALGSPNFLKEHHGAVALAAALARGELGDTQMLVRPHPLFDNGDEARALREFEPRVRVQRTATPGTPLTKRAMDLGDVSDWVSTFRHADVVVNLSSTATVDAAINDRPVVNLDFDPEPGSPNQTLVKEINHAWPHFRPVAESGGVWLVESVEEMVVAIREYLARPELHAAGRQWIVEHVCGFADGRCGERLGEALLDFAEKRRPRTAKAVR